MGAVGAPSVGEVVLVLPAKRPIRTARSCVVGARLRRLYTAQGVQGAFRHERGDAVTDAAVRDIVEAVQDRGIADGPSVPHERQGDKAHGESDHIAILHGSPSDQLTNAHRLA